MTNFLLAGILVTMLLGAPTVLVLVAKLVVGTIRTVVSLVKLAAFGGFFISVWELLPTPPEWWGSYRTTGSALMALFAAGTLWVGVRVLWAEAADGGYTKRSQPHLHRDLRVEPKLLAPPQH